MIEMTNDEPMPTWRNFMAWSGVGAILYMLVMGAGISLLHEDGASEALRSREVAAMLGLALIFGAAVAGFGGRKRPVSRRNLRNFVIRDGVAVIVFLLVLWAFVALDGAGMLGAMGASEWVAAATGSVLLVFAVLGTLATASAHTGADLIDDEEAADDLRERGRMFLYSFAWVAACGLLLIVLGLAGPGGLLPRPAALAFALLLVVVLAVLAVAVWRLGDELVRTLSHEAGNIAFYMILLLGGGWAMLAHLGFIAGPAPLDWVTSLIVLMFAASFIAAGRRKLLTR